MCGFRKYPCSPYGRLLEIPKGGFLLRKRLLEESMKLNCNSRGVGEGIQTKNLWRYRYFWEEHTVVKLLDLPKQATV